MNLASDVRFSIRSLSKAPVFTAVAVLSLALGIGANTAIFTLIDQLILRMLPVKNPTELVLLDSDGDHCQERSQHRSGPARIPPIQRLC